MGIGLVDPILPALATQLHATPSQVELLFTSYFAITGPGHARRRRNLNGVRPLYLKGSDPL
jgi:hypothetical protein